MYVTVIKNFKKKKIFSLMKNLEKNDETNYELWKRNLKK